MTVATPVPSPVSSDSRQRVFRVLTLSGSLRAASSNTALLQAAESLSPPQLNLYQYTAWGEMPSFNPNREDNAPGSVQAFREALRYADAVLIASAEYAHGVPGAFKNALDWVLGSGTALVALTALWQAV